MKKTIKNAISSLTAKLAALLFAFTCAGTAWGAADTSWYDESQTSFTLTTEAQLRGLAELVNGGTTFAGKMVTLGADIDVGSSQWTPIGLNGDTVGFNGVFDGANHKISNLTVDNTSEPQYRGAAFFGSCRGTVKNLRFENANISCATTGNSVGQTVNGAAVCIASRQAETAGAYVENIYVKNATVIGNRYVAAIVGYCQGTVRNCTIEDVTIIGIPDNFSGSYDNGDKCGGIVGYCNGAVTLEGNTIKGNFSITAHRDVGGLVGYVQSGTVLSGNTIADGATVTVTMDKVTRNNSSKLTSGILIGANASAASSGTAGVSVEDANTISASATTAQKTITTAVAKIGSDEYGTLAAATYAYQSGDTIELVGDASSMTAPEGWIINPGTPATLSVDPMTTWTKVADGFYQNAATYAESTDFYITSKEGLEYFRDLVNQVGTVADTYVTTYVNASWTAASWYTGNIFTGKTVHLMTDVDLENAEWSPIGQPTNAAGDKRCFYGNFDGEGHKVSNLKATTYTEAIKTWYAGLFGNVAGTQTFSNLTIENVTLVGYDYAGAIIGNAGSNATAFNNCHVTGNIDIKCTMVGAFVGGIVGIGTSAIDDCSVEGTAGSTIQGSTVGGLAGTSTRTAKENANTVTDSTVTGVTVKSDDNGGQAGGLVGKATNPVTVTGNTVHDVTVSAEKGDADALVSAGTTTASNNTTDTNVTIVEHFVAQIGETKYKTLKEAINAVGDGDVVIELLDDATLDYNAREAYGTAGTTKLTIKGNGKTLTLNQKNSDWSSLGLKNAEATLAFENITINKTGYGETGGSWNTHAIIVSSKCTMDKVTVNQSLDLQKDATLTNVTINEANGFYGLWLPANGQTVTFEGGSINATNGGRGIKIADQYVGGPESVKLTLKDLDINTAAKAAVLVTSTAGAEITATDVDITDVAKDSENIVWVDEARSTKFGEVTLNGGQTYPEGGPTEYAATLSSNGKIEGYYKTLDAVVDAYEEGDTITALNYVEGTTVVPEGWGPVTENDVTTLVQLPVIATVTAGGETKNYYDLHKALEAGKAAGSVVTLQADVDLEDADWTPVGTSSDPFYGSFDGNGHTIKNLWVSSEDGNAGLFGWIGKINSLGGTFKNLTLENVSNVCKQNSAGNVGTLAGFANTTLISNITVKTATVVGRTEVAGLTGNAYTSKILDCHLEDVTVTCGYGRTGGIAGQGYCTISGCSVTGLNLTGAWAAGGIIGLCNACTITDNYVQGALRADKNYGDTYKIGGIVGTYNETAKQTISGNYCNATVFNYQHSTIDYFPIVGMLNASTPPAESIEALAENSWSREIFDTDNVGMANYDKGIPRDNNLVAIMDDLQYVEAGTVTFVSASGLTAETAAAAINAEGNYRAIANADGTVTIIAYVAQIGTTKYETLAEAIATAEAGQMVELIADTTEDAVISIAKNVTVDFGGKTATLPGFNVTGGTVVFKNGSVAGSSSGSSTFQLDGGSVTLTDVNATSLRHVLRIEGASVVIESGSYSVIGAAGGTHHAINIGSGSAPLSTLAIKGGTFTGPKGMLSESGAALCVQKNAQVTVEDGQFSGGKNTTVVVWDGADNNALAISGGVFDMAVDAKFCATGYEPASNTDAETKEAYPYAVKGAGYGGEALPAAPVFAGDTITVTPQNIQYTLDGAYGSIDGKTIVLSEGAYPKLYFARATKYPASGTEYYKEQGETRYTTIADIQAHRNEWGTCHYNRTMQNVTLKPADGATVTIAGAECTSGHITGPAYDYLLDYSGESGSMYYLSQTVSNITFDGLTFTGKVNFETSASGDGYGEWHTTIAGVTFDGCTFTGSGTASSAGPALRYYSESATGYVSGLTITDCTFKNWYQGVYCNGSKDITVTKSAFDTTGHNAIAVQTQAAANAGAIAITDNTFKNIGDRVIRFGSFATGTEITITGNTATNSGDSDGEVIKASGVADGIPVTMASNTWDQGAKSGSPEFGAAGIGTTYYMSLTDAIAAANSQNVDEITILNGATESPDAAWKVADGKLVRKVYVAQIGTTKYETLAAALAAALDGETVTLISGPDTAISAAGEVTGGKTVTVTGTAKFNWDGGWLMVGRGNNAGDGTLIFKDATITRSSDQASYGFNISCKKNGSANTCNGTVIITNSTIDCDFMINKGTLAVYGKGTVGETPDLTVHNGWGVGGRPASETESGEHATATVALSEGAYVKVVFHNGMGNGYEGNAVMTLTDGSVFEYTGDSFANGDNCSAGATGKIVIDATSLFKATKFQNTANGNSSIAIDATGITAPVKVIDCTNSGATDLAGYGTVTVTGGEAYVEDGDLWVKKPAVAQIGDTYYDTFAAAIAAADAAVAGGNDDPVIIALDPTAAQDNGDWKFVTDDSVVPAVTKLVRKVYVAQIDTTKYETVEAALADAQGSGATIEILANSTETPDHALEVLMGGNITLTASTPVRVEIAPTAKTSSVDNDGMAYIRSAGAAARCTFTVGENVTLAFPATAAGKGAMYIGYSSANAADMVINGRLELYEPYVGSLSTLTVNPSGSIKSISECLIVRWGATVDIVGTGAEWSDANPQAEFAYVSLQGGVTTLKDTYAKGGAWVQIYDRNNKAPDYETKLVLDNSVLATSKINNETVIELDCDSQIVTPVVQNTGAINIDATGITQAAKVIDYTGSGTLALADYGTVTVTAGEAYVDGNDLWVKKPSVAQIGETKYETLEAAIAAADAANVDEITILDDSITTSPDPAWYVYGTTLKRDTGRDLWYVAGAKETTYGTYAEALSAANDDAAKVFCLWSGYSKTVAEAIAAGSLVVEKHDRFEIEGYTGETAGFLHVKDARGLASLAGFKDYCDANCRPGGSNGKDSNDAFYWTSPAKWTVVLDCNIDLDNKAWTTSQTGMWIKIDGDNHTVLNLSVSASSGKAGLFTDCGLVSNLKVDGATVSAGSGTAGAVVAWQGGGGIENVVVSNAVVSGKYVGGIVGQAYGRTYTGNVLGNVSVTTTTKYVGGIAGQFYVDGKQLYEVDIQNNALNDIQIAYFDPNEIYGSVLGALISASAPYVVTGNTANNITTNGTLAVRWDNDTSDAYNALWAPRRPDDTTHALNPNVTYANNALTPHYLSQFVYPIEGTAGVPVASEWLAAQFPSIYPDATKPILASITNDLVTALSENGANNMPKWESYVLGLNPADATAVLRLGATAKDATTVTITGSVDTTKFPSISNVTVTFRLAAQNGAEWTDIATGAETPSFDVSLDDVAGKVLTIFADIVTK